MEIFTVSFFGHRRIDRFAYAERRVAELIGGLLREKEYVDFLVGRDGEFDTIVSSAIRRAKQNIFDANSSHICILPYERAEYRDNVEEFEKYYDEIEICEKSNLTFIFSQQTAPCSPKGTRCRFYFTPLMAFASDFYYF